MKFLKGIVVLIIVNIFVISPSFGLDFDTADSTSYYHGDLPSIVSVKLDKMQSSTAHITLNQAINGCLNVFVEGESFECVLFKDGKGIVNDVVLNQEVSYVNIASYQNKATSKGKLIYQTNSGNAKHIPLWVSLLPPLIAILLALVFREVIVSLFAGIVIGSWAVYGFAFTKLPLALFKSVERFIMDSFADWGHGAIIIFSMLIGGMVAIISRNGGMVGVVNKLSK